MVGLNFSGRWGKERESKGSKSNKMVVKGFGKVDESWDCLFLAWVVAEQKGFSYSWGNILTATCQKDSTRKLSLGF